MQEFFKTLKMVSMTFIEIVQIVKKTVFYFVNKH